MGARYGITMTALGMVLVVVVVWRMSRTEYQVRGLPSTPFFLRPI